MPAMKRDPLVELPEALTHPRPRADARFIMGVDGGATKTLAAVMDLRSRTLHLAHGGPSNEDAVGAESAVKALLQTAEEAIARAGICAQDLGAAVLGVAGTDTAAGAGHGRERRGPGLLRSPERRGPREPRLLQAAHQGRDSCLRRGNREARR